MIDPDRLMYEDTGNGYVTLGKWAFVELVDQAKQAESLLLEKARWNYHRRVLMNTVTYISSPTMGLPPGKDASDFALSGATEGAARYALSNCILNARGAIAMVESAHPTPLLHVEDAVRHAANDDDMCPNCVTPWKCNGPHISEEGLW